MPDLATTRYELCRVGRRGSPTTTRTTHRVSAIARRRARCRLICFTGGRAAWGEIGWSTYIVCWAVDSATPSSVLVTPTTSTSVAVLTGSGHLAGTTSSTATATQVWAIRSVLVVATTLRCPAVDRTGSTVGTATTSSRQAAGPTTLKAAKETTN